MNWKALVVGAVLGFMGAVVPSCGAPAAAKCSADTCGGCCVEDKCEAGTTASACGVGGGACGTCSVTETCQAGVCAASAPQGLDGGLVLLPDGGYALADGGTPGCSPTTCSTGCCSKYDVGGVCFKGDQLTACGKGGGLCASCTGSQTCANQTCTGGSSIVGNACNNGSECGAGYTCRKSTLYDAGTYAGGYCTKSCLLSSCPTGSTCVSLPREYAEEPICWKNCTQPSDCRNPGYACYELTNELGLPTGSACWLDPLPQLPPSDKVGAACTTDVMCQNPPPDGLCLPESIPLPDGGQQSTGAVGGYCSLVCSFDSDCGDAGLCIDVGTTTLCQSTCAGPDLGQSTCRTGYVCLKLTSADGGTIFFPDGGSPPGVCAPNCNNLSGFCGDAGFACTAEGYCRRP